ncbi:hypothetical protein P170DRAFT_435734 [Aspergillus steynii IBT 23096]|uniref:Uncharacterized protein n=1 Tax=Aspergillus steynii IBT 23096 TaxID=1392250 RepID=A0A2I2GCC8_9EURO|nr:uncharacterized protein P170DRAFT_435734 [Aspergillus steynii IBT 23096]PLB50538.1 hypothetical protein P170DRAFT_435734 [Aspergillus steynii IBT 23096]
MGHLERCHHVESQDEENSAYRSWVSVLVWCAIGYLCMITLFVAACFSKPSWLELGLLPVLVRGGPLSPFFAFSRGSERFQKPKGLDIIALVPFHHHERTAVLECYLQRNLAYNHGFLDQVIFIPRTNHTDSLEWLASTVDGTPLYATWKSGDSLASSQQGKEVLYIWIDGDMVFLEDHTIPTVVKTKLDHPDSIVVSANVINAAALQALHSHPGLALPYLPELLPEASKMPSRPTLPQDWRTSKLPQWDGPANFSVLKGFSPPSENHRWLLSSDNGADRTPIGTSVYTDQGPGLDHWTVHAQQHYSFLHHLEAGDLYRYKFPIWKNPNEAISQSFLCFRGEEYDLFRPFVQHEHAKGPPSKMTRETRDPNRKIIIDGKGLVVHYTMGTTSEGLETTDILHRYRAYAQEKVCLNTA